VPVSPENPSLLKSKLDEFLSSWEKGAASASHQQVKKPVARPLFDSILPSAR
jgi:hypothetical protein